MMVFMKKNNFCWLCGHNEMHVVHTNKFWHGNYDKLICKACGVITTVGIDINTLESAHAMNYSSQVYSNGLPKWPAIYKHAINSMAKYHRIKNLLKGKGAILDLSANTGEFMHLLRMKGYEVYGIEHNPFFVHYIETELKLNVQRHFLDSILLEHNKYDMIIAHNILQCYIDPLALLQKCRQAMKDDGLLNIQIPNIETLFSARASKLSLTNINCFNLHTIRLLIKKAGFSIMNAILIPSSLSINMILAKKPINNDVIDRVESYKNEDSYTDVVNAIGHRATILRLTSKPYYMHKIKEFMNALKYKYMANKYQDRTALLNEMFSNIPL